MFRQILWTLVCGMVLFCESPVWAKGGGVFVGNGGDHIKVEESPLSMSELHQQVLDSRLFIGSWIKSLENSLELMGDLEKILPKDSALYRGIKKIFSDQDIYSLLDRVRIDFRVDGLCPSNRGPREGSVLSQERSVLCLSGTALISQLKREDSLVELNGLILHEISHLLGASEEEATALQQSYMNDMKFITQAQLYQAYQIRIGELMDLENLLSVMMAQPYGNDRGLCLQAKQSVDLAERITERSPAFGITFFSSKNKNLGQLTQEWLRLMKEYICHQEKSHDGLSAWQRKYKDAFGNNIEIDLNLLISKMTGTPIPRSRYRIKALKIINDEVLFHELFVIQSYVSELRSHLEISQRKPFKLE